jgi:hypothetical protein
MAKSCSVFNSFFFPMYEIKIPEASAAITFLYMIFWIRYFLTEKGMGPLTE